MSRKWLRNRRNELGLFQEDMADLCYISRTYYSQLETGVRGNRMSVDLMNRIALTCNVSVNDIALDEISYQNSRKRKVRR